MSTWLPLLWFVPVAVLLGLIIFSSYALWRYSSYVRKRRQHYLDHGNRKQGVRDGDQDDAR